jgi:hypothetical protein
VYYGSSYPPTTSAGVISLLSARDAVNVLAATQTMRYWRFHFDLVFGPFTLGKLLLAQIVDLGKNPSSQNERERLPNVIDEGADETPLVSIVGDRRMIFTLRFRSISATTLSQLRSAAMSGQSFIIIDRDDTAFEVIAVDMELERDLKWISGSAPLYDCDLIVRQLG